MGRSVTWLLAAALLTGIGWLAVLPAWEGFDEGAHFSSIQQIADDHSIPRQRDARLSADVERYAALAPYAYGGMTYHEFFVRGNVAGAKDELGQRPGTPRKYAPGSGGNWQAQHPPLYYVALAPVYLATKGWSWIHQLFVLRSVSYLFALGGLALGILGTRRYLPDLIRRDQPVLAGATPAVVWAMAAWPFLFPMFFPEMARLGNDSLCLLLMGAGWFLLLQTMARGDPVSGYLGLSVTLGLGLLTKAFFMGIAGGVVLFFALRLFGEWRSGASRADLARQGTGLAVAALLPWAIGGGWYLYQRITYGATTGALEQMAVQQFGGVISGLADTFSWTRLGRGMATIFGTFIWGGTGSLARIPELFHAPLLALEFGIFGAYLYHLARFRTAPLNWAPLLIAAPMFLGLCYHVLIRLVLSGHGVGTLGTPGWYLHMLAAPLGFAAALGLINLGSSRRLRLILAALFAYTFVYFLVAFGYQLMFYAGCMVKVPETKHFGFPAEPACSGGLPAVFQHLETLGQPRLGIPLVVAGLAMAAFALVRGFRHLPEPSYHLASRQI